MSRTFRLKKGGGGSPCLFVKLDFEIAVDQQTKAHDRTFEGVPDSGCPPVPAVQPRSYLVNFGSILPNHLNMLKTMLLGAIIVATSLLNTYTRLFFLLLSKSDKNLPSYEQNTICAYLGIRTKYDRFWHINWANINIFE